MVTATAQFLYSPDHCKILHLVRHGQGMHNVAAEKSVEALLSPKLFDAPISTLGWQQVANLRKHVFASGMLKRIELVITSPQSRAMQTAVGVFGCESHTYEYGLDTCTPPVMAANDHRNATPALNCPPILAFEKCRDRMGVRPSDKRRSVSEYQSLFPTIDFSLMECEEDDLWNPDVRESLEEISARMVEFMQWLWTRPEKEIVIVSHGVVLQHLLYVLEIDTHPSVKIQLTERFGNCELRSVVVVNKSMMDSDSSATSFCG
ncbi:hypothetical protein Patl1_08720 [Pistacia atlantica]|uniref:Uncharacterized protein n=1 Tax=Pistacia atlantica TaxID=434234 RepID=A0ACC1AL47_9ROSI|nr:hypothetical protein Patl1_08720 [Pistacia atlantica]